MEEINELRRLVIPEAVKKLLFLFSAIDLFVMRTVAP